MLTLLTALTLSKISLKMYYNYYFNYSLKCLHLLNVFIKNVTLALCLHFVGCKAVRKHAKLYKLI